MFERILVPLDGSGAAETVLSTVEWLRGRFGATVTLLHVPEKDSPASIHGEPHLGGPAAARAYLDSIARTAFPPDAGVKVHVHQDPVDDLARGLAEHAVELDQDLLVLCVHGRGGLDRLFEGSIGERIMRHRTAPVLLLRPETPPALPLGRMLLALDGNTAHEQSIPVAGEFARAAGMSIVLAMVVPTMWTMKGSGRAAGYFSPSVARESLRYSELGAGSYLEAKAKILGRQGTATKSRVGRGDPARRLAAIASEEGADLLVMGTHGRAGTGAFWAESTAVRILKRTRLPALLVPSE